MKAQAILIFNPEEAVRDSLYYILREEGYRCLLASNDSEVLKRLIAEPIDMLILDNEVPHLLTFLERVKEVKPITKIILLTSYAETEVTQHALSHGADDFVLKPLDFDELIMQVKKLLLPTAG